MTRFWVRTLVLGIGLLAGVASTEAAHITDKLAAGVYETPDASQTPIKAVPSGTPLEVIKREGDFIQVRLPDGTRGWVEAEYVTDQKPARVMLLQAQAKAREAQTKLAAAEEELAKLRNGTEQARAAAQESAAKQTETITHLKTQLAEARQRIVELENGGQEKPPSAGGEKTEPAAADGELETLRLQQERDRETIERLKGELAEVRAEAGKWEEAARAAASDPFVGETVSSARAEVVSETPSGWFWVGLGVALLIGFIAGVAVLDYLQRRRHGGFRI